MEKRNYKEARKELLRGVTLLEKSVEDFHASMREHKDFNEVFIDQLKEFNRKYIELNTLVINMEPPNHLLVGLFAILSQIYPAIYLSDSEEINDVIQFLGSRMELNNMTGGEIN
jgi:hypothetical protein